MSQLLTPKKQLDLNTSLIRVASIMLKELHRRGVVDFEQMRTLVLRRVGPNGEFNFLPALDFLFLLGRVDYHAKNDVLEYKGD